ncbi:4-(cytidine 5'-diphospho)-2-C-methyl-D-erythritol kinase [Thioclava sp. SK-1]|uniref:4-(cytidine 5'-diphospho)-2-C-methyl-D-erythritol kinase n=1 Tax=Thioclava sp. SK-1 TaxID=1889770 RepID=UPI000824AB6C|nr:4-(cytidine 5'-diphospho)-2-C-methyl-D-erythritol kinase [Thioclava sp. SK-1]OCX62838.1 4-(cytidine 5'-diphospho)-2-C-methyl-D-erythritol kinase [Thioclava sp. SK-1]
MTLRVYAPAKVNLTLHVTGQRDDGYHLLDSLVSFAQVSDHLQVSDADHLSLCVTGPEARGVPADDNNLVMKAARAIGQVYGIEPKLALQLHKNLPSASGIGGGSADAAACVRAVLAHWDVPLDLADARLRDAVQGLGADVWMCLASVPCRVRGIGNTLSPVALPDVACLLVNPRVEVPTPPVFKALPTKTNAPMPQMLPEDPSLEAFIAFLAAQRNDLQSPAIALAPVIASVVKTLQEVPGCQLARMSGSGATCFGLFPTIGMAHAAQAQIAAQQTGWWCAAGLLGSQSGQGAPHRI